MDDIVIIDNDKEQLRGYWQDIAEFLLTHLGLQLNNKSTMQATRDGIDFCGYRVWADHIRLRQKSALKMKHRLRYLREAYGRGEAELGEVTASLTSYCGLLKHCDGYQLKKRILHDLVLVRHRRGEKP